MIPSIAIIGRKTDEGYEAPVSRPMRQRQPHFQSNPMRVAFRRHRELGHVRIRIGSQRAHVTFPKTGKLFDECNPAGKSIHPSVACHLRADTGALSRCTLSAARLRFDFSRRFQAPGSRINSGLSSAVRQDLRRYRTKSFHVFLSLLCHEDHHGRRNGQGVVKV